MFNYTVNVYYSGKITWVYEIVKSHENTQNWYRIQEYLLTNKITNRSRII